MKNALLAMLALGMSLSVMPALAQAPPRPVPASAPAAPAPSADVDVQIMVVHANNAHTRVDSRLEGLLGHLRHLDYTGFDVLQTQTEKLQDSGNARYDVAGSREIRVNLIGHDAENARLRIRMFTGESKVLDTTVSVRRNRSFIVMGPRHNDGVLILPITVRY